MIASPTFVIISGLLLGFLYHASAGAFAGIRNRTIDRGLLLILVVHPLILIAIAPYEHTLALSISTDAIGFSMIVGALLIPFLPPAARLGIGFGAYLLAWIVVFDWHPATRGAVGFKEVIFGTTGPEIFRIGTFPCLQWFGVYFASTALGERLAVLYGAREARRAVNETATVAAAMLSASAIILAGRWLRFPGAMPHVVGEGVLSRAMLHTAQKYPPGPEYLLFYGGLGLTLLASLMALDIANCRSRLLTIAATWGQTSLFVFVVHYYLFWIALTPLKGGRPGLWILYFVPLVLAIGALSSRWDRLGYNRFLTLGLGRGDFLTRLLPAAEHPVLLAARTDAVD